MFIEDLIEALLEIGLCEKAYGEVFNIGKGVGITFFELAQTIISLTGKGRIEFVPFTPERKILEPGDYVGNYSKIKQIVGWEATTELYSGLETTLNYYLLNREHYWRPDYEKAKRNE
jgi:UDP-glucose 4-epimerase